MKGAKKIFQFRFPCIQDSISNTCIHPIKLTGNYSKRKHLSFLVFLDSQYSYLFFSPFLLEAITERSVVSRENKEMRLGIASWSFILITLLVFLVRSSYVIQLNQIISLLT